MKRVLLVQPSLQPPGGSNGLAAWVLQALLPEHRVTVLSWQPVIDGVVVTNQTLDLLALGRIHTDIPVVIGTVHDELVL